MLRRFPHQSITVSPARSPAALRDRSGARHGRHFVALACAAAALATAQAGESGASPVSDAPDRQPALAAVISAGESETARKLLERQAPGGPQTQEALLAACRHGDLALLALTLARGANPNHPGAPLAIAAGRNSAAAVDLLLTYGADPALTPEALHEAVAHQNAAMAASLLAAGADPNAPGAGGRTPLATAIHSGQTGIVRILLQHGGCPDDFVEPALAAGDVSLLRILLEFGLSPDQTDAAGNPLMVRAAMDGKTEAAALLLSLGANPEKTGTEGQTALHFAAAAKNEPLLRALLDGGTDPNQPFLSPVKTEFLERIDDEPFKKWLRRDAGLTPLMLAASRGDTGMVRLLLSKGAKRGLQSKNWKRFPVMFACDNQHIPAAQVLLGRNPGGEEPGHRVSISLSKQRATLYKGDKAVRSCRVSTGRKGYATPSGKFVITDKQREWMSSIYKVAMPFFMRLNCREIGLHAGNCPGYPASHGCIRMPSGDVQAFFSVLEIGDAVSIEE